MKLLKYACMAGLTLVVGAGCGSEEEKPEETAEVCADVDCGNGTCVEERGAATCECDAGYRASGLRCMDEETAAVCTNVDCGNGTCVAEDGVAACDCDEGYQADGLSCVETEPADPCEELCGATPRHGTWSCGADTCKLECDEGYDEGDKVCTPVVQALTPALEEDASISSASPGATSLDFGALFVGSGKDHTAEYRSFLEFDLGGIPKDFQVKRAVLALTARIVGEPFVSQVLVGAYFPETLLSESSTWTWNEHSEASGRVLRPSEQVTVGPDEGTYDFDLRDVVQDWLQRSEGRNHLTLVVRHAVKPDLYRSFYFYSMESPALKPPRLVLEVAPPE